MVLSEKVTPFTIFGLKSVSCYQIKKMTAEKQITTKTLVYVDFSWYLYTRFQKNQSEK